MKTKVLLYARWSPRPLIEGHDPSANQLADLREEAAKRDWKVVGEFNDPDRSGDDEDRPAIWEALAQAQSGMVLFVWNSSRLARSVYFSEYLHKVFRKKGCRIEYLHGTNGEKPEDILVRQIMAAVDEHQKKVSAMRTKHRMLVHQKNGRLMSKKPPFGTKIDPNNPKRIIPEPKELKLIPEIMHYKEQGWQEWKIAKIMAEKGFKFRGNPIGRAAVRAVLKALRGDQLL